MGSQRVGHDWATSLHFTRLHFQFFFKKQKRTCPLTGLCSLHIHHSSCLSVFPFFYQLLLGGFYFFPFPAKLAPFTHCPLTHFLHLSTCFALTTLPNVLSQRLFLRYTFWMQGLQVFLFLDFFAAFDQISCPSLAARTVMPGLHSSPSRRRLSLSVCPHLFL